MKKKNKVKELLFDLLFPKRCPICDEIIGFGKGYICKSCRESIHFIGKDFCMKCGKPLEGEEEYCFDCKSRRHSYHRGAAVFEYHSIAPAIYRFKYGGRQEYAEFFGRCMAERLGEQIKQWNPQALVPVPIHRSRRRIRGYNQAELLAEVLSRQIEIPVKKNLIIRIKKTVPQKALNDRERQNNLKKAFKILKNDVKLNTIVIIDDIYTTGNTIDSMADVLREAGIEKIYYAALAIGKGI